MKRNLALKLVLGILFSGFIFYGSSIPSTASSINMAQNKITQKLHGTVIDSKGEPVVGATVAVKGQPENWLLTDVDGNFDIKLSKGDIIEINYLGFIPVSISYNGESSLKIILKEDTKVLNEVVVTALGIKKQTKALPYNVQEIKGNSLTKTADVNFASALNGKLAGVTINHSSSGIGSAARVVMRGTKSIEKSNNALYVIDGVPLLNFSDKQGQGQFASNGSTESAADINPDDIASISVLTGASAAALYGSAAANGAIIITTKQGREGNLKVNYSFSQQWGRPLILPKFQSLYGADGGLQSWGSSIPNNRWSVNKFLQTSNLRTHNFSLSGGTKKNRLYASYSNTSSNGLVPNNIYNRNNFNIRNTTYLLDDRLSIDASVSYVNEYHRNMINQGEYMNPLAAAYLMPRELTNAQVANYESFDSNRNIWVQNWIYGKGDYTLQNPYWQAYRNVRDTKRERYILALTTKYDIIRWDSSQAWNVAARVNMDNTNFISSDKRWASTESTLDVSNNGYYSQKRGMTKQIYADIISTINKSFDVSQNNNLSVNATIGGSFQSQSYDESFVGGPLNPNGFPNLFNIFNIDQNAKKTLLMPKGWNEQQQSLFASAEIGYNNYLYLTLTGRNDWASQLANSPKTSFFYPSVGLSALVTEMLSEEVKEKISPVLGYLKLRGAISSVASPFQRGITSPTYNPDPDSKSYTNISTFPVGKLYPERTNSYELGFSSRWFGGHFTLDASYYHTNTSNQTLSVKVPPASGYSGMYIQAGSVINKGVELSAGLNFGSAEGLYYSTNFTMSYNKNIVAKVAEEYENPITGKKQSLSDLEVNSLGSLHYIVRKGGSLGDIYTSADFKRDVQGNIFVSEDGNMDVVSLNNYVKLGSVLPDANYGWSHELSWKGISVGALLTARQGGVVVSMTQAALDNYGVSYNTGVFRNGVPVEGTILPAKNYYQARGRNRLAQYYTYDATNIRLAEAHISYTIPRKWLFNVTDMTLSFYGRNLCLLYNKAPFDPESISSTANFSQGLDYFMLPSQRTWGFNIKLSF